MTKFSPQITQPLTDEHELLFIEFGSRNKVFYGKDLDETREMIERHKGQIVYLCDDPDLPLPFWKDLSAEKIGQFVVWNNCLNPREDRSIPNEVPAFDFPFSALQSQLDPIMEYSYYFLYIGRPKGREMICRQIAEAKIPWLVCAKPAEWSGFPEVICAEPPAQAERTFFYRRHLGCLALADSKHKRMGWRTGRAYHAILAGCPVVAEADHPALQGFTTFKSPSDLHQIFLDWSDPRIRLHAIERQRSAIIEDLTICRQRATELGL